MALIATCCVRVQVSASTPYKPLMHPGRLLSYRFLNYFLIDVMFILFMPIIILLLWAKFTFVSARNSIYRWICSKGILLSRFMRFGCVCSLNNMRVITFCSYYLTNMAITYVTLLVRIYFRFVIVNGNLVLLLPVIIIFCMDEFVKHNEVELINVEFFLRFFKKLAPVPFYPIAGVKWDGQGATKFRPLFLLPKGFAK